MSKRNKFLYNPHEQDKEDLIAHFVVRQHIFKRIFADIKASDMEKPEQHYYIEGQRGMGKTTLLLRLSYEIENDDELSEWLIPVLLKEEAYYGISKLHRLWEEVAKNLAIHDCFMGLYLKMEQSYKEGIDYEKLCFELLIDALHKHKKKILIMLDNLNEILDNFSDMESHRFREILLTCSDIRFIGASSRPLEASYNYKHAFFDFFKLITLKQLDETETKLVLMELSKIYNQEHKIKSIIQNNPERIEALRILTGGVIRTIVLLFDIFVSKESINSFSALEKVLDGTTTLYKHRIDDLKPYQREIVDIIALNWDGMLADEIALKARQPLARIQEILNEIEKAYVIESLIEKGQKTFYQIRERFFNIWYLMRVAPDSGKKKILWLVRFLNTYYSRTEIREQAVHYLKSIGKGLYSPSETLLRAEIFRSTEQLDSDLEHDLLTKTRTFLSERDKNAAKHLSKSNKDNLQHAKILYRDGKHKLALDYLKSCSTRYNHLIGCLFYDSGEYTAAIPYFEASLKEDEKHIKSRNSLGNCYAYLQDYDTAIENYNLALSIDSSFHQSWGNLALCYQNKDNYEEAKRCLQEALKYVPDDANNLNGMAYSYFKLDDYDNAVDYYLKAHQLDPTNLHTLESIVICYENLQQYHKAIEYQHLLWKTNVKNSQHLVQLVSLYTKNKDWTKAIEYQEKLVDLLPLDQTRRSKLLELQGKQALELGYYDELVELLAKIGKPVSIRTDHLQAFEDDDYSEVVKTIKKRGFRVDSWSLPFYDTYKLYKFTPEGAYPIEWFYALANGQDFLPLDLTNTPLYTAAENQFKLDGLNLMSYILLFFDAVSGKHGKFYIVRGIDEIIWNKEKEVEEKLKLELESHFEESSEVELVNGKYVQSYSMTFKNSLFTATIHIDSKTGLVTLSEEKLVIEAMPILEVDENIKLHYVKYLKKLVEERTYTFQSLKELAEINTVSSDDYQNAIKYYAMALEIKPNDLNILTSLAEVHLLDGEVNMALDTYISAFDLGANYLAAAISDLYRKNVIDKSKAMYYAELAYSDSKDVDTLIIYVYALLWNDRINEAKEISAVLFNTSYEDDILKQIIDLSLMFAAKGQGSFILNHLYKMELEKWDFFKPLRYSLQKITGNGEYKRSPSELHKTIDDMVNKIAKLKDRYY